MNLVFVVELWETASLESTPLIWVVRVSCHGMVTGDDGRTTSVTSNASTSPCFVQLTSICRSLSTSLRTPLSTSHVLPSAVVYLSLASRVKAHANPDKFKRRQNSAFCAMDRKSRTCSDSLVGYAVKWWSALLVCHLQTKDGMVYAFAVEWRQANSWLTS